MSNCTCYDNGEDIITRHCPIHGEQAMPQQWANPSTPDTTSSQLLSIELQELTADMNITDRQFVKLLQFIERHHQAAVDELVGTAISDKEDGRLVLSTVQLDSLMQKHTREAVDTLLDELEREIEHKVKVLTINGFEESAIANGQYVRVDRLKHLLTQKRKERNGTEVMSSKKDIEEPTIDWLIDQIAPNPGNSPLVNFNKERLRKLIAAQDRNSRIDEVQQLAAIAKDDPNYQIPRSQLLERIAELKHQADSEKENV